MNNYKYLVLKICIPILVIFLILGAGFGGGYSAGNTTGWDAGWDKGTIHGKPIGNEKGYAAGFDKGKEYVVANIDKYAHIIKPVTYDEAVKFIETDKTDELTNSDELDINKIAVILKENANKQGIKCALVILELATVDVQIWFNAFETTDKGIVFLDPRFDVFFDDQKELITHMEGILAELHPQTPQYRNINPYSLRGGVGSRSTAAYKVTNLRIIW